MNYLAFLMKAFDAQGTNSFNVSMFKISGQAHCKIVDTLPDLLKTRDFPFVLSMPQL